MSGRQPPCPFLLDDTRADLANRRASPEPGNDTRLVSVGILSGAKVEVPAGAGVKFNPAFVGATVGYVRKDKEGSGAGIYYADGRGGPKGDVRAAAWSTAVRARWLANTCNTTIRQVRCFGPIGSPATGVQRTVPS